MDFKQTGRIELTTSPEDWKAIRECYVRSFYHYPLYKYMVPEESKREEFLRAYLDANYEVTVGSGQGILLAIRVPEDDEKAFQEQSNKPGMKVVGGVVFVPPSNDDCGWAIGSDEPYWQAYEKHGLGKISKDGLERVKRYEAWENEHISKKASATRIPLWNGFFCAISPNYASKGLGSAIYNEAIRTMAKYWVKQQQQQQLMKSNKLPSAKEDNSIMSKLFGNSSLCQLYRYTLFSHRVIPFAAFTQNSESKKELRSVEDEDVSKSSSNAKNKVSVKDVMFNPNAPLVVAISHSERSAHFHQSNGFHPASRLPFYDEVEDVTPFYAHVLVLDPFCTGRLNELINGLQRANKSLEFDSTFQFYNEIKAAKPDVTVIE